MIGGGSVALAAHDSAVLSEDVRFRAPAGRDVHQHLVVVAQQPGGAELVGQERLLRGALRPVDRTARPDLVAVLTAQGREYERSPSVVRNAYSTSFALHNWVNITPLIDADAVATWRICPMNESSAPWDAASDSGSFNAAA